MQDFVPSAFHTSSRAQATESQRAADELNSPSVQPNTPSETNRPQQETQQNTSTYLMESSREGARLEAKTDLDAAATQLNLTGLRSGMQALDLGCGTGAVTRVMAKLAAPGRVVGADMSKSRLAQARQLAVEQGLEIDFVESEATKLQLPSATFDFTWSRFLFEYLAQPEQALAEMIRVTRPGGTVVVGDLDGQLEQFYPLDPTIGADLVESLRLLGETGFDPWVGRKLYHWFFKAGLRDIMVHVAPYQVYVGGLGERDMLNWREKLLTGTERLIERTGHRARWERFRDEMFNQLQRRDIFYYCTLIMVQGTVPAE